MKEQGRQTGYCELARGRRRRFAWFATVLVACTVLVGVVAMGAQGAPPIGGMTRTGAANVSTRSDAGDTPSGVPGGTLPDTTTGSSGAAGKVDSTHASDAPGSSQSTGEKISKPARTPAGVEIPEEMVPTVNAEHEKEDVLVTFAEGYSPEELTAAIEASGCTVPQAITDEDVKAGFATLKVADGYDVEHAMTQLGMLPELGGAQPNFIYRLQDDVAGDDAADLRADLLNGGASALGSGAASDSLLAQATSINDAYRDELWALDSVNAYQAWDTARADGEVTVAVFDNGCLVSHEDLDENIAGQYDAIHNDDEIEAGKHGTHVTGIVAAEANNEVGVAGVSFNAKVLPVQVLSAATSEGNTSTVITAFNYVFENHPDVKVINMSFGGTIDETDINEVSLDDIDRALVNAVNTAYEKGILTVCSAGNDANKKGRAYLNFPSDWLDNALGVIALANGTDGDEPTRAGYSNYNMEGQSTKDISAPGSGIYSTGPNSDSHYISNSGTSMAAPCVAGVAALVYRARPDATAAEVSDIICQTANKVNASSASYDEEGFSLMYGYGEVDAEAAVLAAKSAHLRGDGSLLVGSTVQLEPVNLDDTHAQGDWAWSSSDESVATVVDGVVTGVSGGTVTVTAKSGNVELRKDVVVYEASFSGESTLAYGSVAAIEFTTVPVKGSWNLESSNKEVASVSPLETDGKSTVNVMGVGCGTATLTASSASNPAVKASFEVTVVPADMGSATIEPIDDREYTGSEVKPEPTITFNGSKLSLGTDYRLTYRNNIKANDDLASSDAPTVVVEGVGNFAGTAEVPFRICRKSIGDAAVSLGEYSFTYNGAAHEPSVTVTCGGSTLTPGTDYEVSYADNVNAGQARVTVRGRGCYTGTAQEGFTIGKARVMAPMAATGLVYTGAKQTGVESGKFFTLSGTSVAINAGSYKATARLADPGNYQWSDGTTGAKAVSWSIGAKSVKPTITFSKACLVYNGSVQKPTVKVKAGSKVLSNADYTVSWPAGCKNAGTYKVKVTCKGNYKGTAARSYKITPASIAKAKVSVVPKACRYTGKAVKPNIIVKLGSKTLVKGTHYKVSYADNKRIGTASVTVKGKGNYKGKVTKTFKIVWKLA